MKLTEIYYIHSIIYYRENIEIKTSQEKYMGQNQVRPNMELYIHILIYFLQVHQSCSIMNE